MQDISAVFSMRRIRWLESEHMAKRIQSHPLMYLGGNHHNYNGGKPPPGGGVFSQLEGQGSVLNLSLRAASDVEKQGNQAQKIKTSKIR